MLFFICTLKFAQSYAFFLTYIHPKFLKFIKIFHIPAIPAIDSSH